MDPAFGQAISALNSGINNLPESYAAGQRHLLAQQVAAFNQHDKDRTYEMNKPLVEARTKYHLAQTRETEGKLLAAELFPELSRKFLRPVRGMNGEPDRIEFNNDPNVMAEVVANLTSRGINPENVINAYRTGVAGQLAAASKPGTSMPSANAQIAASRIGKDFGATASSIFSVEDRDTMAKAKEDAAAGRVTQAQDAAWKRAQLAADTAKENARLAQAGQDARTAAGIKSRQEIAAERIRAGVGTNRRETAISPEIMRLVDGDPLPDGRRVGGLSSAVLQLAPKDADGKPRAGWNPAAARKVYSDAFYAAYRATNPPNAPAAAEAALKAAKEFIDGGERPISPSASVTPGTPADAIVATTTTPPAAAPYAAPTFSDPAENIANARLDQIAASLNMSRQDLIELAKQQGMSVDEYVKSINTPAAEPPEEPANLIDPEIVQNSGYTNLDTLRTPDTKPNVGAGVIPAADRLLETTAAAVSGLPASPLDSMPQQAPAQDPSLEVPPASPEEMLYETERAKLTPKEQAIYDKNKADFDAKQNTPWTPPPIDQKLVDELGEQYRVEHAWRVADNEFLSANTELPGETPAAPVAEAPQAAPVATPAQAVVAPVPAQPATPSAPVDPLETPGMLAGTNRGFPHPYHLNNFGKPDPLAKTAPGTQYGNTYDTAFKPTAVDNSDAWFTEAIRESQTKSLNDIGMPKQAAVESRTYKPSEYLYKPDVVEQVMQQSGIDRKSHFGRRVEELQREKYSLMNSIASLSTPGTELTGSTKDLSERLMRLNQKIDSIMNNPYAKISPSAALIVEDFVNTPGLVVNSLSDVPNEANRKYVLKQSEVIHLLKTFTNVTPLPNGNFSVLYPMPTKDNQFVSKLIGQTSRYYATSTPSDAKPSGYIEGDRMFAAFDRAHADVQKLFIREGRLGMKPGDSLARTLVNLTIRSNMEIAKAGQAGLLDDLAKPRNWFQGIIQYPFK